MSVQVNGIAAQACASWLTYMLRRRYWYICWADTSWLTIHLPLGRTYYDGGTDTYICWADTSWLTIHLHLPLGRTYMLRRRYISWGEQHHLGGATYTTHTGTVWRSRIAYTFYLGGRLYHSLYLYTCIYIYGANITWAALHVHFLPGRTSRLDIHHYLLGGDTFHGGPACLGRQLLGRL